MSTENCDLNDQEKQKQQNNLETVIQVKSFAKMSSFNIVTIFHFIQNKHPQTAFTSKWCKKKGRHDLHVESNSIDTSEVFLFSFYSSLIQCENKQFLVAILYSNESLWSDTIRKHQTRCRDTHYWFNITAPQKKTREKQKLANIVRTTWRFDVGCLFVCVCVCDSSVLSFPQFVCRRFEVSVCSISRFIFSIQKEHGKNYVCT